MFKKLLVLALTFAFLAVPASASVYRITSSDGSITITNSFSIPDIKVAPNSLVTTATTTFIKGPTVGGIVFQIPSGTAVASINSSGTYSVGSSTYGATSASINGSVSASGFTAGSSTYGATSSSINGGLTATSAIINGTLQLSPLTTAGVILNSASGVLSSSAGPLAITNGGTGSSTKNFIDLTTAQTIAGTKNFLQPIVFSANTSTIPTGSVAVTNQISANASGGNGETNFYTLYNGAATSAPAYTFAAASGGATTPAVFGTLYRNGFIQFNGLELNSNSVATLADDASGSAGWNMSTGASSTLGFRFWKGTPGSTFSPLTASAFTVGSDRRIKKDIKPLTNALHDIMRLRPVTFRYRADNKPSMGFIAQDVRAVYPNIVVSTTKSGLLGVNYGAITSPLVASVQELQREIQHQQARIDALEAAAQPLTKGPSNSCVFF